MTLMRRLFWASILQLAIISLGCSSKPDSVKVGIAMNLRNHKAVEMAVKEINDAGGIAGVRMELVGLEWKVDRPYEAKEVLLWANRFAEVKDLMVVIGHNDSASTLSAAALYNQKKIPQIVTIATNPAITNIGGWTYRLCISDSVQGPALAEYAVQEWKKKRIAVFYVNDDYGRALARLFEKRVQELGAIIVASVMHRNELSNEDEQLIRNTLAEFKKNAEPDLVAIFQRPAAAALTLKALRELGLHSDVLGGDSLGLIDFSAADPELTEGMRVAQFFALTPDNRRGLEMARRYRDLTGSDPDYGQAFAYDAIYLVRDAVLNGGFTREKLKSYLDRVIREKVPIEGAGGTYILGIDHDARRPFHIVEVRAGRHQYLTSLGSH